MRAAFRFFEERPDFVRLVRWEALEGGPILRDELAVILRPLFERGAAFLEREMDAGRLRRYDARQLLLTGYGAVLSYLSDAPLMTGLLDIDPLSTDALAARREHVIDVLRNAVAPVATRVRAPFRSASGPASASSSAASPNTSTASGAIAAPDEQQQVGRGAARGDVALRVLARDDEAVGRRGARSHSPSPSVQCRWIVSPAPRRRVGREAQPA